MNSDLILVPSTYLDDASGINSDKVVHYTN